MTVNPNSKRTGEDRIVDRKRAYARFYDRNILDYRSAVFDTLRAACRQPETWIELGIAPSESTTKNVMRQLQGLRAKLKRDYLHFVKGYSELLLKEYDFEFKKEFDGLLPPLLKKSEMRRSHKIYVRIAPVTKTTKQILLDAGLLHK